MRLGWIAISGFRSHGSLEWHPDPGTNLVIGRNGAGKTNLLEAIGYLATLRSFRGAPDEALVDYESDSAIDRGEVEGFDTKTLIEVEIRRRGGRRALVNRQRLPRTTDLLGYVRLVAFLPEDLEIVKGGPSERRRLLDDLSVQVWPASHLEQMEFDRALRQRNAFLRIGDRDVVTLGVWDERLAMAAGKVAARRARIVSLLGGVVDESYRRIAGSDAQVSFEFDSDWGASLDLQTTAGEFTDRCRDALERGRRADQERRMTLAGPHRDDPMLMLDHHDLRYHGSQGEQRTAVLALRLAGHRVIEKVVGEPPILLLDDVFSELDAGRSAALAGALPATGQAFISTADRRDVPVEGRVWHLEAGRIT
jgi:DNA replication and repair protein RecF